MTLDELTDKVREWDLRGGTAIATSKFSKIFGQLNYHAKNEWRDYLPSKHSNYTQDYMERLAAWVGNVTDENEQMLLLEYASYISYFSHSDFQALYQCAMNREVYRWIAEQSGVRLELSDAESFHNEVDNEVRKHTWFCPVTDSMDINEFYKVNHLEGMGHRPGFSTLKMLSEGPATPDPILAGNVAQYMTNPGLSSTYPYPELKRIVILEDIVGSGSQSADAVEWALMNLAKPVLFIPLILCPIGVSTFQTLENRWHGLLTVRPVVELKRGDLIGPERQGCAGWPITSSLEALVRRTAVDVGTHEAFGYKDTGCSLALYSNTPDNTPPLVHKRNGSSWEPLFPRVHRGAT